MNLNFAYIYEVRIEKVRREALTDQQDFFYDTEEQTVLIVADDLEDAINKTRDYAQELLKESIWEFYDIVDADRLSEVFTGITESESTEELVEEDLIPEPEIPENGSVPDAAGYSLNDLSDDYFIAI